MNERHLSAVPVEWTALQLSRDPSGIAYLTIDCPGTSANTLSSAVLSELNQVIDALQAAPPKGLVIQSGKPDSFISGADIHAFDALTSTDAALALVVQGYETFERLAALPFPTLALIQGACMGGGLELALACTRRIVVDTPRTRISLPEVMLGIVPGWGGMKRLPALIGPAAALDMMLTGRSIDARKAVRLGLADFKAAPRVMALAASKHVLSSRRPAQGTPMARLLNRTPLRALVAKRAHRTVDARDPQHHYPAPRAIIDIWAEHGGDPRQAPDTLHALFSGPQVPNLLRVFHLQERLKTLARPAQATGKANPAPARIHVIGAGTMGGDIACWCAYKGLTVTLQDTDAGRIAQAQARAHRLFAKRLKDPRLVRDAFDRLIPDPHGHGVARADVVLEAIVEDADAKRALYRSIEPRMRIDAVLATNTSSLLLQDLYPALQLPQRLVGVHFFNPVARLPLVEIVRSSVSGPSYLATAFQWMNVLGKLPLPVKDVPGFLVNAVLAPYMHEAIRCVDDGMAPESIDAAMVAYGMPVGPVELADRVGLDVVHAAGKQLVGDAEPSPSLTRLLEKSHLGQKSGQGFYEWRDGRPIKRDKGRSDPDLVNRLITPLREQAHRQLAAGVVEDADLVDAGMIFGAGYAPFTGGPLHQQN